MIDSQDLIYKTPKPQNPSSFMTASLPFFVCKNEISLDEKKFQQPLISGYERKE
jgi:hypothetical protein